MIVPNVVNAADSNVAAEARALRINGTAQAFKLLSDGLYSDKISAILRELGSNAVDSHQAAGKADVPFEVKLPNRLDPTFYVRDFGVGLSETDVYDLYLTYFSSSKQRSNEFIGGFGIGSKSPFAYTDSFTVISVKDGLQHTFAVYLDVDAPKVVKLAECPASSEWPSGLEVGFAVKPEDFSAFAVKASDIYAWFAVRPQIKGEACSFVHADVKATFSHAAILARKVKPLVRVGGCVYTLPDRIFSADPNMNWLLEFSGSTVILEAAIGRVALTGSRESISFDAAGQTQAYISELADVALLEIMRYALEPLFETYQGNQSGDLSMWNRLSAASQRLSSLGTGHLGWALQLRACEGLLPLISAEVREKVNSSLTGSPKGKYVSPYSVSAILPLQSINLEQEVIFNCPLNIQQAYPGERDNQPVVYWKDWGRGGTGYGSIATSLKYGQQLVMLTQWSPTIKARVRQLVLDTSRSVFCFILPGETQISKMLRLMGEPSALRLDDLPIVVRKPKSKLSTAPREDAQNSLGPLAFLAKPMPCLYVPGQKLVKSAQLATSYTADRPLVYCLRQGKELFSEEGCSHLLAAPTADSAWFEWLTQVGVDRPVAILLPTQLARLQKAGVPVESLRQLQRRLLPQFDEWSTAAWSKIQVDDPSVVAIAQELMGPHSALGQMLERFQAVLYAIRPVTGYDDDVETERLERLLSIPLFGRLASLVLQVPSLLSASSRDYSRGARTWLIADLPWAEAELHPTVRTAVELVLELARTYPLLSASFAVAGKAQGQELLYQLAQQLKLI